MDDITTDAGIEAMVLEAQKRTCCIYSHQLQEDDGRHDMIIAALSTFAKNKLLSYGLIEKEKTNGYYLLTLRGIQFKSFNDEDEKVELIGRKLKFDVRISERVIKTYHTTRIFAWFGFIAGVFLLLLKLAEVLKLWPYHK